jgi:hypothetical protein
MLFIGGRAKELRRDGKLRNNILERYSGGGVAQLQRSLQILRKSHGLIKLQRNDPPKLHVQERLRSPARSIDGKETAGVISAEQKLHRHLHAEINKQWRYQFQLSRKLTIYHPRQNQSQ